MRFFFFFFFQAEDGIRDGHVTGVQTCALPIYPNNIEGKKGRNSTHLFVNALKLATYPSLVFFDSDGSVIQAIGGFKGVQELELYLRMVATDEYKEITTPAAWEAYQKNFKSSF